MAPKVKPKRQLNEEQRRSEAEGAVRRVDRKFNLRVPDAALSSGVHEVPEAELKAAAELPVPDGRYRIIGLDWVHEFKGGKWVASYKARPDIDPEGIVLVP